MHVWRGKRPASCLAPHPRNAIGSRTLAMALPSVIFFAICLAVLAVLVLLQQRRFLPLRSSPEYLLVATFLPLFISSSIVVLVPVDLASSSATDDGSRGWCRAACSLLNVFVLTLLVLGVVLPARFLLVAWRIAYWLCFVLTWYAVCPTCSLGWLIVLGPSFHCYSRSACQATDPPRNASSKHFEKTLGTI